MPIFIADALAGAGKSYAALRFAGRRATRRGQKFLIVQPSMHLIEQSAADLRAVYPELRVTVIHGGTHPEQVVKEIIRHSRETVDGGEVVFITQAAFLLMPFFARKHRWQVIIDETINVHESCEMDVTDADRLFLRSITVSHDTAKYSRVLPANRPFLRRVATGKAGPAMMHWRNLAKQIISPHHDVWTLAIHGKFLIGAEPGRANLFSVMRASAVLGGVDDPDCWASVTVMSAGLRDTLMYRQWTTDGTAFRTHGAITKALRYTSHGTGDRLTIHYAVDGNWSKSRRDTEIEFGGGKFRTADVIGAAVLNVLGDSPFVFMANKDQADPFDGRGTRLPNSPHGLNEFQSYHNVVVTSALNPPSAHYAFLSFCGINGEEAKTAIYRACVYQAVMRGSLRNPSDITPAQVVVMDKATAEWLADLFPGAVVKSLHIDKYIPANGKDGRKRIHAGHAEQMVAHRLRKKAAQLITIDAINGSAAKELWDDFTAWVTHLDSQEQAAKLKIRDETPIDSPYGVSSRKLGGIHPDTAPAGAPTLANALSDATGAMAQYNGAGFSGWANTEEPLPLAQAPYPGHAEFIAFLRDHAARTFVKKEHNCLISPARFDPYARGATTRRGRRNVVSACGLFLDNDGAANGPGISPDQFADLFPGLEMAIFNSYSSTPERAKWRVFIPVTHGLPALTYIALIQQIMKVLADNGYRDASWLRKNPGANATEHGFDMSKVYPENLFYLPAQAAHPEASFFYHYAASRKPLDVVQWILHSIIDERPEPAPASAPVTPAPTVAPKLCSKAMRAMVDRLGADDRVRRVTPALDRWRSACHLPGEGHGAFYNLRRDLQRAGLGDGAIRQTLWSEAAFARNPAERRAEINHIMRPISRP